MLGLNINYYYTMRKPLTAKNWLRERSDHASVSIRDGFAVFHDRGNTLIRRGLYYEPNTRKALFALCVLDVQRGNTLQIADVGANIGLHTVFFARRFPDATIHAYDPSPQSVRYLKHTIDYNGLEERFTCTNVHLARQRAPWSCIRGVLKVRLTVSRIPRGCQGGHQ